MQSRSIEKLDNLAHSRRGRKIKGEEKQRPAGEPQLNVSAQKEADVVLGKIDFELDLET